MANCTPTTMEFSPLNRKKIEASFTGGSIGSDGGILLLRELDKRLGLTKKISRQIKDTRHPSYIQHSIETLLKQRVYAIACGYEDVNDHDQLRQDHCFQLGVGREMNLASSATLSRFENAIDRKSLVAISQEMVEHFIRQHNTPPKEISLDFDPTDHTIYGHQADRHYHGYYKDYCYLPLHVFCKEHLLVSLLRPSNLDASRYAGAILKLLVKRFRQVWPNVKILFRGDSAFTRKFIFSWCERHQVDYISGMAGNQCLQRLAKPWVDKAEKAYKSTDQKQRLFGELLYAAGSWSRQRRVIVKAEHHEKGDNLRFVVTSLPHDPNTVYSDYYCPRGNMENGIKQLKLDFYSDRNSCQAFLANQCRLLLSSLAYILLTELKSVNGKVTTLTKAYGRTVRLKLLKIGVVILKNTRHIRFLLASHHPYQNDFRRIATSLNSS